MARRRKADRRAALHHGESEALGSFLLPYAATGGIPARGGGPERCHAAGSALDVRRDTPAGVRRAERAADGGVVDVPRALSVSLRAP